MRVIPVIAIVCFLASMAGAETASQKLSLAADPFTLTDVRLLDGPFRDAMVRDQEYVLSLNPDRLLHNFRVNVGLPSSAQPLGGWEDPKSELRGHSLGHYLSALSLMYASTGNAEYKRRVDYIVGELAKCQSHSVTAGFHEGYLSAFPESFIDRVEQGQKVWAPWYTLHKIMAGLLDANQLCGNEQSSTLLTNMANWVKFRVDRLTREQMQKSLDNEHGGMNEVLANLYGVTGNPNYLQLAQAFNHQKVLAPLARGEDQLDGLHANTQIPKILGATREYEMTGDPQLLTIAKTFWDAVALHRSYTIGGDSDHEYLFSTNDFDHHLSPETCETCNTYNMLKLTRELFALEPSARKMDFYERALFNDILASQDPESGMFTYYMSLKPGHFKVYSTRENSFWCCVGTGMENHAKYGDTIYFHTADALYVNLFIASELSWSEKGLVVRQETRFPESDKTVLKIKAGQPVKFALKIRQPAWATEGVKVSVNGENQKIESAPDNYFSIQRQWRDGDEVTVQLPMQLHCEYLPGTTNQLALLYGPIVLAGKLGTNAMPNPLVGANEHSYSKLPSSAVPVFVGEPSEILNHIEQVTGQPMTFRTHGFSQPEDVTLVPFYQIHRERYSVYWKLVSQAEWKLQTAAAAQVGKPLNLEKLRNPVWTSHDNLRDPSVLKTQDGYHLFYSRFSIGEWNNPTNWAIADVFTKDFVHFENDHDVSPKGCASPGDVVFWQGRWLLPYQTYPSKPTQLVFAESTDLQNWSAPKPFLVEALKLPWNELHRVIDPSFVVDGETLHCFFIGSAYRTNENGQKIHGNLMGHAITHDPNLKKWEMLTPHAPLIGFSDSAPDGVENTMIFKTDDHWTMIYSEGLENQHLALATSPDLMKWKLEGPIELPRQKWMSRKYGAPYVWRDGSQWLMVLMGTDDRNRTTFGLLTSPDGRQWKLLQEQ